MNAYLLLLSNSKVKTQLNQGHEDKSYVLTFQSFGVSFMKTPSQILSLKSRDAGGV